jgi:hypothetical protein
MQASRRELFINVLISAVMVFAINAGFGMNKTVNSVAFLALIFFVFGTSISLLRGRGKTNALLQGVTDGIGALIGGMLALLV